MRSNRLPMNLLIGWTLFVWLTRARNIVTDDDLSTGEAVWRLAVVVAFVGLAVALVVARRSDRLPVTPVLGVTVIWTIGYWLVRGTGIIIDDHELGFTIVHTVLMAISIGLVAWAWRRRAG